MAKNVVALNKKITEGDGSEGVVEAHDFGPDATNEELVSTINTWIKESEDYHNSLLKQQEKCVDYYRGKQTNRGTGTIPEFNPDTVHNRIFEATETITPIISGTAHQFVAMPVNSNPDSLKTSQKVQHMLDLLYERLEVSKHIENAVRDIILKRFGVLEYFWDKETDDIGIRTVDPRLILIPQLRVDANDLPYVIKILEFSTAELNDNFPETDISKLRSGKPRDTGKEKHQPTTMFQVFEVWTPEYVVWMNNDTVVKKMQNPYWDFDGEGEKGEQKKFFNHLEKPTIPIIFLNPFRTGESPVAEVSLCEVVIPIQDDINVQKRQIIKNLISMGNGQIYIDKGALEDEMIDQITDEPGLQIVGDGVASENRVRREPGTPLPSAHFSNLQDSKQAFDTIFGVNPSVRGADESKTLGGQILNREQNLSRIDLITRNVNRGIARLADGIVQLQKMFYTDERAVRFLGADDAIHFMTFSRDDIDDDLVIDVKSGQTAQMDPVQLGNRAIQLWQLGALDPTTLYRMLDFPNPEETAQRLLAYLQGQLLQETNAEIAKGDAGAEAKAKADKQREVETNTNSRQRSEQSTTGTGPTKLPKKSK